mgnify:CR=1 FL=1
MKNIDASISQYLSEIGRAGDRKSRRSLSSETARDMVRIREARKAFHAFHAQCFWYMREDMKITLQDIPEIVRGLRQNGGRQGFLLAATLCR